MERKTKIKAEDNTQQIFISREFELPLELLFKAYVEADIVEQWMGTKVLKLNNEKHGSFLFETTDPFGNKHIFSGSIHEFIPNNRIVRTFEMENTSFPAQLEFLEFQNLNNYTSLLKIHVIYKSVEIRDQILKLPFAEGINMAHNRLENIFKQ